MILTGPEIARAVSRGEIQLSPFSMRNINPNSYNYHLGNTLKVTRRKWIDAKKDVKWTTIPMQNGGYVLSPSRLYLANTREKIGSAQYVVTLIGRSSLGRLGMFVQISAELGHLGTYHQWTLELRVAQRVRIYPGMTIGQICFWRPDGRKQMYHGHYAAHDAPTGPILDAMWP